MATEKQIQKMLGILVEHLELFLALLGEHAQWVIENPKEAIELFVKAVKNREQKVKEKIFELVETRIIIPAMTEKFIVNDNFIVDTGKKAKVKIYGFGSNFASWFLDKIEGPTQETILSSNKLLKYLLDKEIISVLGGEGKVETKLAHVFYLMSQQPNGETGILLTNGWANIFYIIRDSNDNLCTVDAHWDGDGWRLHAISVDSPRRWRDGCYIFSPQILET